MRSKITNPVSLLLIFSFACAFMLGGAPPSASDEGRLTEVYGEEAESDFSYFSRYALAAGLVPVPLQIQLIEVSANSQTSGKTLFQKIRSMVDNSLLLPHTAAVKTQPQKAAPVNEPAQVQKPYLVHTVKNGETLTDIARKYNVSVDTIVNVNTLGSIHRLKVGQLLNIITVDGLLYTVKKGESLWDISKRYKVDLQKVVAVNGLGSPDQLKPRQMIVLPGAKPLPVPVVKQPATHTTSSSAKAKTTTATARKRPVVSTAGRLQRAFAWPVRGRITSRFGSRWGRMHEGIDISVGSGTPVRAASAGRVTFAGWGGAYGYLVKIDHGNGVETRYAHNSRLLVKVGQSVGSGQVLARSGSTGRSTGPHVHFEIRKSGKPYNPLSYLN